jgi:single-strand DNA-binding protein
MDTHTPTQNLVHITGYIGIAPQLRDMGNGDYVANIVVYTKRSWRRGDQTIIQNDRLPLTAYGQLAHSAARLTSGQLVQFTARLKNDRWQDRVTGEWRSALRVIITALAVITRPAPVQEAAEEPEAEQPPTEPAADATDEPPEAEQPRRRSRRRS